MATSSTNSRARDALIIAVCLVLFFVVGLLLERSISPPRAGAALFDDAGPMSSSAGRLGRIARQLGLDDRAASSLLLAPGSMPSSVVIDSSQLDPEWPVLSIVAEESDLHDAERGILANPLERGREWERLAFASYYEQGELIFATRAGLRRHGGASRRRPEEPSLRLYFREEYGSNLSHQAMLDEVVARPSRIVVRKAAPVLATTLAFEIARRIGAPTPAFKLAQLYLNGDLQGAYLLSEHVHPDGWGRTHFGHEQIAMYVLRGSESTNAGSVEQATEFYEWAGSLPAPLDMEVLETRIDLDNMFRNLFTFIYCGTGDWAQGAVVRDESRDDSRWFWVHWDLDHSFRFRRRITPTRRTFELLVNPQWEDAKVDPRGALFRRLLEEDPAFPQTFARLAMDLLNHRLRGEFFGELLARYEHALPDAQAESYRQFFARRADHVRREMQSYLRAGEVHNVTIEAPAHLELAIDGYPEKGGFSGAYFEGTTITVESPEGRPHDSLYWLVNGARRDESTLVIVVNEPTTIEAVVGP